MRIKYFFEKIVLPISQDEDKARSEFILNVLLTAIIGLSFVALVINLFRLFFGFADSAQGVINLSILSFISFSFFIFLYFLARKGFSASVSFIFLGVLFLLVSYTAIIYGVDIPEGLLVFALIIIMAGILVSTQFAFFVTLLTTIFILLIGYLQINLILPVQSYWRAELLNTANVIMIIVIFSIIAVVSWLSNREIEKSLVRARRSEAELKKERDSLEVTVEARTRELKETQAEKMTQLYRFAEFGRLSSGLFHDLINPLTAVSLNIEKIKDLEQNIGPHPHIEFAVQKTDATPISETATYVDKAIVAAKKMEDMVSAVRKQLSRQETKTLFSVSAEAAQAIEVLSHKAMKAKVNIRFLANNEIKTYGDAIKFNQIALNLIINAIDAYNVAGEVAVSLNKKNGLIILEVKDKGIGISEENKSRLFEPFFTTKEEGYGLGIGLSIIKRIVEKDFGGSISVESREGKGSTFTAKFPQRNSNE